jgi:hypothetical protein
VADIQGVSISNTPLLKEIRDFIRQNNATQDDLKELLKQQVEATEEITNG